MPTLSRRPAPPRFAEGGRATRVAITALCFLDGFVFATWVSRIPAIRAHLGLTTGQLGLALLGVSAGALTAMPIAGCAAGRRGSRAVCAVSGLGFCAALAVPPLSDGFATLTASLVLLGATNGALDVAVNAQAASLERFRGRRILASVHAAFSLGGLAGGAVGGLAAGAGLAPATHLTTVAAASAFVAALAVGPLLPGGTRPATPGRARRGLLPLGALAFCCLVGEGAMADWSGVYLAGPAGAGPALAASGYAFFSAAMATSRLSGDALAARVGAARLLRGGATLAAVGLATALILGRPVAGVVGLVCMGGGLGTVMPLVVSAAARGSEPDAGRAIAAVSTVGYLGFLAGPPLIGISAQALSLPVALGIVVLLTAAIVPLARYVD